MDTYKLFKGFKLIGEFRSILKAKKAGQAGDGVYKLIGSSGYRSSWIILNGTYYGD